MLFYFQNQKLADADITIHELQQQITQQSNTIFERDNKIQELELKQYQIELERSTTAATATHMSTAHETLLTKYHTLEQTYAELQLTYRTESTAYNLLKSNNESLQQQLEALQINHLHKTEELQQQIHKVATANANQLHLENNVSMLEQKVKELTTALSTANNNVSNLSNKIQECELQQRTVLAEKDHLATTHTLLKQRYDELCQQLQSLTTDLSTQSSQSTVQLSTHVSQLEAERKAKMEIQQQLNRCTTDYTLLQQTHELQLKQYDTLLQQYRTLQDTLSDTQTKYNELQQKYNDIRHMQTLYDESKLSTTQQHELNVTLHNTIRTLENKINDLQNECIHERDRAEHYQNLYQTTLKDLTSCKELLATVEANHNAALLAATNAAQATVAAHAKYPTQHTHSRIHSRHFSHHSLPTIPSVEELATVPTDALVHHPTAASSAAVNDPSTLTLNETLFRHSQINAYTERDPWFHTQSNKADSYIQLQYTQQALIVNNEQLKIEVNELNDIIQRQKEKIETLTKNMQHSDEECYNWKNQHHQINMEMTHINNKLQDITTKYDNLTREHEQMVNK